MIPEHLSEIKTVAPSVVTTTPEELLSTTKSVKYHSPKPAHQSSNGHVKGESSNAKIERKLPQTLHGTRSSDPRLTTHGEENEDNDPLVVHTNSPLEVTSSKMSPEETGSLKYNNEEGLEKKPSDTTTSVDHLHETPTITPDRDPRTSSKSR